MPKTFFIYILASKSRVIYTGVTSDLQKRLWEHRTKLKSGFTKQYRVDRLVYFEATESALAAISREKQIKGWRRSRKDALIEKVNPAWDDLSEHLKLVLPIKKNAIQLKAVSSVLHPSE